MADQVTTERFRDGTAHDWKNWLEDYCVYSDLKKWNVQKQVSNLRFFVAGEVKNCVRQICAECPTATLETISTEVAKLLGGTPDPLSAIRQLDSVCYNGNVGQTLLSLGEVIPLAYPTITDKTHKDQMTCIHLQKLLPADYQRELIKAGVDRLDAAVERVRAFERADAAVRLPTVGLHRTQSGPVSVRPPPPRGRTGPTITSLFGGVGSYPTAATTLLVPIIHKSNFASYIAKYRSTQSFFYSIFGTSPKIPFHFSLFRPFKSLSPDKHAPYFICVFRRGLNLLQICEPVIWRVFGPSGGVRF